MTHISAIEGNGQFLDGGAMFGNAPRTVWEKWIAPDSLGRIALACRSLYVEWNSTNLLCEAGVGCFFEPKLAERFGVQNPTQHLLLEGLEKLKVSPADVKYVVLSHLHFDHAGGLLPSYNEIQAGRKDLVFPNARFIVGERAWQRALNPHPRDRASFVPLLNQLLKDSGRLIVYPKDPLPKELLGKIEFIETEGHTPGQMHSLIQGDQGKVFFCGDLVPGLPWVHLPITMGYDRFPEKLIDEKAQIFERAVRENWLLFYTHDPSHAASHIQLSGSRFEPTHVQNSFFARRLI